MNRKISYIAAVAAVAFMLGLKRTDRPADLRDAVTDQLPADVMDVEVPLPELMAVEAVSPGGKAALPFKPVEWVTINGGKFTMGNGDEDARPAHKVSIGTFEMSKTPVTVQQYEECYNHGVCTPPSANDEYCNWRKAGRQYHPVNCVTWEEASQYARFKGGRLPSEAEWEYAAKSGGKDQKYPWGNVIASCDRAVMTGSGRDDCGKHGTQPVCSRPAGNTAQGLCDMAGNVWQWVQDNYYGSYRGAPADGSAVEDSGLIRAIRGGSFSMDADYLRTDRRNGVVPSFRLNFIGFRIARSG